MRRSHGGDAPAARQSTSSAGRARLADAGMRPARGAVAFVVAVGMIRPTSTPRRVDRRRRRRRARASPVRRVCSARRAASSERLAISGRAEPSCSRSAVPACRCSGSRSSSRGRSSTSRSGGPPEHRVHGPRAAPRFADFFYYAVSTAFISPPGDILRALARRPQRDDDRDADRFRAADGVPLELRRLGARARPAGAEPTGSGLALTARAPREVLVAAAGEADDDQLGVEVVRRARARASDSSAGMIPSVSGEPVERGERLVVGRGDVLGAARVAEERVLRADARVVEPGRDRVRVGDLAVLVGEDRRARAVQDGGAAACRGSPRPPPRRRPARRRRRR